MAVVEDYDYEADKGHDQDNLTGDKQASEDLPIWGQKEDLADVKFGEALTYDQNRELQLMVLRFTEIFSDRPGDTNLAEHRIALPMYLYVIRRILYHSPWSLLLGLVGYYQPFIPNFVAIAAPLSDLTRKGQPNKIVWGEPQERAYAILKKVVISKPILMLPDVNKKFVLRRDASDIGLGATLLQNRDGHIFLSIMQA